MMTHENYSDLCDRFDQLDRRLDRIERTLSDKNPFRTGDLMTVEEAAKEYKLAKNTLYRWRSVQVKIAGAVRISRSAMNKKIQRPGRLK